MTWIELDTLTTINLNLLCFISVSWKSDSFLLVFNSVFRKEKNLLQVYMCNVILRDGLAMLWQSTRYNRVRGTNGNATSIAKVI